MALSFLNYKKRRYKYTEVNTIQYYLYDFISRVYKLPTSFKHFNILDSVKPASFDTSVS